MSRGSTSGSTGGSTGGSLSGEDTGAGSDDGCPGLEISGDPSQAGRYRAAVCADTPLAYWALEETSEPMAVDATGTGHGGVFHNGVLRGQAGVFADGSSTAPRFDGTNWIEVDGDAFTFADRSPYSIEAWVRADPGPDPNTGSLIKTVAAKVVLIDGVNHGWMLRINDDRATTERNPGKWLASDAGFVPAEQATHLVATYDGDNLVLYINGTEVRIAQGVTDGLPAMTESLRLGAARSTTKFRGIIDEVAIFGYALSPQRVADHFFAAQP